MGKFLDICRQFVSPLRSPVFLTMLVISFFLWYGLKMSHVYTTDIPIVVKIEGERYRIRCMVEARGTELWSQRISFGSKYNISLAELSPRVNSPEDQYYTLNTSALGNAIMQRSGSIKVLEVIEAPQIEIKTDQ
jgi:hypothetical protein